MGGARPVTQEGRTRLADSTEGLALRHAEGEKIRFMLRYPWILIILCAPPAFLSSCGPPRTGLAVAGGSGCGQHPRRESQLELEGPDTFRRDRAARLPSRSPNPAIPPSPWSTRWPTLLGASAGGDRGRGQRPGGCALDPIDPPKSTAPILGVTLRGPTPGALGRGRRGNGPDPAPHRSGVRQTGPPGLASALGWGARS